MSLIQTSNIWLNAVGNTRIGAEGSDVRLVGSNNSIKISNDIHVDRNTSITGTITARRSGAEIVDLTINESINDLVLTDVSPYAAVHSIVYLTPSKSLKITGIDSSSFEYGKTITIRNKTKTIHSNSAVVLFEHQSNNSSSNNKIDFQDNQNPIFLMPEDNIKLTKVRLSTGVTEWKCVGGNRGMSGSRRARYDHHYTPNFFHDSYLVGTSADNLIQVGTENKTVQGENVQFKAFNATLGSSANSITIVGNYAGGCNIGERSLFQFARLAVNSIPVVSPGDNYRFYFGMIDYTWTPDNIPINFVGWAMDRENSTTSWVTKTINSNNYTITTTSVNFLDYEWYALGMFVNGDATRADFFYSLDNCKTWNFVEPHVDNIPSSTAQLSPQAYTARISGTGTRNWFITTWGVIGHQK